MPLLPEKLSSRQEARASCDAQFWEQQMQSPRTFSGQCQTLPCEPPPLSQCAFQGLNKAQQMIAIQALGLPAIPAYNASDGGLVLDRSMVRWGGRNWWGTLLARAKAEQLWRAHRGGGKAGEVLRDMNNYGLATQGRVAISKRCAANFNVELPNVHEARECAQNEGLSVLHQTGPEAVYKGQASVKLQLPGHEVRAKATRNMDYLDSAAMYCNVPLALSLDLASDVRDDGIQYRAGLHQVVAPGQEVAHGSVFGSGSGGKMESSLHLQGAVAVSGEATLWRNTPEHNQWPQARRSMDSPFDDEFEETQAEDRQDGEAGPDEGHQDVASSPAASFSRPTEVQSVPRPVPPAQEGSPLPTSPSQSAEWSWIQPIQWDARSLRRRGGWQGEGSSKPLPPTTSLPLEWDGQDRSGPQAVSAAEPYMHFRPAPAGFPQLKAGDWHWDDQGYKSQLQEIRDMMGEGPMFTSINPPEIQKGLMGARKQIDWARGKVNAAAKQVRETAAIPDTGLQRGKAQGGARRPYNIFLSEPFVKVNGAVGCLTRLPVPQDVFRLRRHKQAAGSSESAGGTTDSDLHRWSKDLWNPYLRKTALRVFASCGLSAQAGRFTKQFGDYTAASIRLDLGLTSAEYPTTGNPSASQAAGSALPLSQPGTPSNGRPLRHRAFALEGTGIWHAATVSLAQQLWGPLRLRLDSRLALDTTAQVQTGATKTLRERMTSAPWVQPVVLETAWGLDLTVPGSRGAARACAWFSPTRREGMVELKLF